LPYSYSSHSPLSFRLYIVYTHLHSITHLPIYILLYSLYNSYPHSHSPHSYSHSVQSFSAFHLFLLFSFSSIFHIIYCICPSLLYPQPPYIHTSTLPI
jgi:hypothetical protein